MAGVKIAKKALGSLLRSLNAGRASKLTVTTANGKLKVCLEESFDKKSDVQPGAKSTKRVSPSRLRRKKRRAADPAVRQRAAEHEALEAASQIEDSLPTPEKERCNSVFSSLQISPVKDNTREEDSLQISPVKDNTIREEDSLPTPEKERCSSVLSSLQISPVKDNTREEEEAVDDHGAGEEAVGKQPAYQLPQDYQDYANFSEWFWADDIKKRDEARHLMSETDRCCFCEYECPPPTQQEDESRILGNLMSMWDHIEVSHPVAHEWMA